MVDSNGNVRTTIYDSVALLTGDNNIWNKAIVVRFCLVYWGVTPQQQPGS